MSVALAMVHASEPGSLSRLSLTAAYCGMRNQFIEKNYGDNAFGLTYWEFSIDHSLCP